MVSAWCEERCTAAQPRPHRVVCAPGVPKGVRGALPLSVCCPFPHSYCRRLQRPAAISMCPGQTAADTVAEGAGAVDAAEACSPTNDSPTSAKFGQCFSFGSTHALKLPVVLPQAPTGSAVSQDEKALDDEFTFGTTTPLVLPDLTHVPRDDSHAGTVAICASPDSGESHLASRCSPPRGSSSRGSPDPARCSPPRGNPLRSSPQCRSYPSHSSPAPSFYGYAQHNAGLGLAQVQELHQVGAHCSTLAQPCYFPAPVPTQLYWSAPPIYESAVEYSPSALSQFQLPAQPGMYSSAALSQFQSPAQPGMYSSSALSHFQAPAQPGMYSSSDLSQFQSPAQPGMQLALEYAASVDDCVRDADDLSKSLPLSVASFSRCGTAHFQREPDCSAQVGHYNSTASTAHMDAPADFDPEKGCDSEFIEELASRPAWWLQLGAKRHSSSGRRTVAAAFAISLLLICVVALVLIVCVDLG